jgi:hypothetical protein
MKRTQPLWVVLTLVFLVASAFGSEILPVKHHVDPVTVDNSTRETAATLTWLEGQTPNTNFGGWTKDYFFEYFVPAADGYVSTIDFNMSDLPDVSGGSMSVTIFEFAYDWPELNTIALADLNYDANLGYYDEATGYEVVGTNWVQGGVNAVEGADADFNYDPLGAQAWPAFGAASLPLEPNANDGGMVNIDLAATTGTVYNFTRGVPFAIVTRFNGFPDGGDATEYRMGYLSGVTDNVDPQPAMKFYGIISSPNGRAGGDDWGWYIRSYVWDWRVNVFYTGDRPPVVSDMDVLPTTLSTAGRTVTATITDDNPSGGAAGVASATLMYSTDEMATWTEVTMTNTSGDVYSGDIPGFGPGTGVYYKIMATDVGGLSDGNLPVFYSIFAPKYPNLVFMGSEWNSIRVMMYYYFYGFGGPDYYFGTSGDDTYNYDVWDANAWGAGTEDLFNLYSHVIYLDDASGNSYDVVEATNDALEAWIAGGTAENPRHLYMGCEEYGTISGYADTTFPAGSFEYDYLGIETLGPQDVNYDGTTESYTLYSNALMPVQDAPLTGFMYDFLGDSVSLWYDPAFETGADNWIDTFTPNDMGTTLMTYVPSGDAVGVHNAGVGFSGTYFSLDVAALNFRADTVGQNHDNMYYWHYDVGNILGEWLVATGAALSIEDDNVTVAPADYRLGAAYPNPFNPSTNFEFAVAEAGNVNITVYNALGQEVATLLNGHKAAGTYMASWDVSGMASGVYFYSMTAPGFNATQKMLLLK